MIDLEHRSQTKLIQTENRMENDPNVGPDGEVEKIEKVTTKRFYEMLEPKIKRFKKKRFIYRVFVIKEERNLAEQQQRSIEMIRETITKLQCHHLGIESGISKLCRKSLKCKIISCTWKALILLIGEIENGLHDNVEVLKNYQGFLIFTGYSGDHRITGKDEHLVMEGFEKIIEIYEFHNVGKYNLEGIRIEKKSSVYKNPEDTWFIGDPIDLKWGLKEIQEIKQLEKAYQNSKDEYNPKEVLDFVIKWIKKLQKEFKSDQMEVQSKLFADIMLDLWFNVVFEDKHQSYPNMAVDEHKKEESIVTEFTTESGITHKKLVIQLNCWDMKSAREYLTKNWRTFCRVANMVGESEIKQWVFPSINFTDSNKVSCVKRMDRDCVVKMEDLRKSIYPNNRKETKADLKLKSQYEGIANFMDIDIETEKADFKSVPDNLNDQKKVIQAKIDEFKKEHDQDYFNMRDSKLKYQHSKDKLDDLHAQLKKCVDLQKHWYYMGPTVMVRCLESQGVKVEQVNESIDVSAQMKRINEPVNYENQYEQAKNKHVPKTEEVAQKQPMLQLKEDPEDFSKRLEMQREAQPSEKPKASLRSKGKFGIKSLSYKTRLQLLTNLKRRVHKTPGSSIILNPKINAKLQELKLKYAYEDKQPFEIQRSTSTNIQLNELNDTKIMESPKNNVLPYNEEVMNQVEVGLNQKTN